MLIVYASRTGNIKRFVGKLDMKSVFVGDVQVVSEPFVLITYTTGIGEIPKEVVSFLEKNNEYLVGVSASGNHIWRLQGTYGMSADKISQMYNVPVISKFDLHGKKGDVKDFIEGVERIEKQRRYEPC